MSKKQCKTCKYYYVEDIGKNGYHAYHITCDADAHALLRNNCTCLIYEKWDEKERRDNEDFLRTITTK